MSTKLAKEVLRKRIQSDLTKLKPECIQRQSKLILLQLQTIPEFQQARSVGLFMSMPMEVNTEKIIELCFEQEKKVYLPRCENKQKENRRKKHLTFLSVPSMDIVKSLSPSGKFNLREPSRGEDVMECDLLDLLIVPGVAFSISGARLGHGAGYYDEFLHAYQDRFGKVPYLIGLGLREQISEVIPTESHDWNLNNVIVPNEECC